MTVSPEIEGIASNMSFIGNAYQYGYKQGLTKSIVGRKVLPAYHKQAYEQGYADGLIIYNQSLLLKLLRKEE